MKGKTIKWPLLPLLTIMLFICGYAILPQSIAFAAVGEVDQARVKEIASLLSKKAAGGPVCSFLATVAGDDTEGADRKTADVRAGSPRMVRPTPHYRSAYGSRIHSREFVLDDGGLSVLAEEVPRSALNRTAAELRDENGLPRIDLSL